MGGSLIFNEPLIGMMDMIDGPWVDMMDMMDGPLVDVIDGSDYYCWMII